MTLVCICFIESILRSEIREESYVDASSYRLSSIGGAFLQLHCGRVVTDSSGFTNRIRSVPTLTCSFGRCTSP